MLNLVQRTLNLTQSSDDKSSEMSEPDLYGSSRQLPTSFANNEGSAVDVLVIGAGPTGLGAAKRLHQLVRHSIEDKFTVELIAITGWPIMDNCRLERDTRGLGFYRRYP